MVSETFLILLKPTVARIGRVSAKYRAATQISANSIDLSPQNALNASARNPLA